MQANRLVIALAVTAVLLSAFVAIHADGPAAPVAAHPTAVGVVDVNRLLNALEEKKQDEADMTTRRDKDDQVDHQKTKEFTDLEEDLKVLAAGSPDYLKKQRQIQDKYVAIKIWRQIEHDNLLIDESLQAANRYRKMLAAIAQVAKDGKYDLILFKEQEPDFRTRDLPPDNIATVFNTIIQVRKVLYTSNDLDITDQVLTRMNNDFHNSGKSAPASAPTP